MSVSTGADTAERPQLADEREIVAGTTTRFIQLVMLLIVSSGGLLSSLWNVTASSDHFGGLGCLLAAGVDVNNGDVAANYVPTLMDSAAFNACNARYESMTPGWANDFWPLGTVLLAALLTFVLPELIRRRRHLVPLAEVDPSGALRAAVLEAVARAGLTREPELVFDPFSRGNGAMVFGRDSRPYLCLGADLVAVFDRDRAAFDAVVLHELAHIRNRDVTVSTATLAVWRVFLLFVALPALGLTLWVIFSGSLNGDPFWVGEAPTLLRGLIYPVLLVALAFLVRADVLRAREVYADRTAGRWGASAHAWEQPDPGAAGLRGLWRTLREAGSMHPRWSLRRRALARPDALFRIDPLQMFLAGAATTMIAVDGGVYVRTGSGGTVGNSWAALLPDVLGALTAVAVAGVALWRAVAYAVLNGEARVPSGLGAGFWFGAGLALAEWESGQTADIQYLPSRPLLLLVSLCAGIGFCWWTAACARLWFTAWPGSDKRPALIVVLAAAALLATAWLGWWPGESSMYSVGIESIRTLTEQAAQSFPGTDSAHRGLLHALALLAPVWVGWNGLLNVIATGALWLVPLGGIALRAPRRLVWALAFGAIAALGGIALAKAAIHTGFPAPDRFTALFVAMTVSWICAAVALASFAASALAAVLVPRHRLPAAIVAAAVTTAVGLAGTFFAESGDGCVRPLAASMRVCVWQPSLGWNLTAQVSGVDLTFAMLAAFAAALVVTGAAALIDRWRTRVQVPRPRGPQPRRARVLVATALVTLGLAVAVVPTVHALDEHSSATSSQQMDAYLAEADTPVNEPNGIRSIQVAAWFSFGGGQFARQLSDAMKRLGDHISQAVAASPSGSIDAQWVSTFESDCRGLTRIAQQAESYFPVPDPGIQEQWAQGLAETTQESGVCVAALQQGKGSAFISAINGLDDAGNRVAGALQSMNAEVGKYGLNG